MNEIPFLYGYIAFVIGILTTLIVMKKWKMLRDESTGYYVPPPGSVGLPLIGETLQFMAAINSSSSSSSQGLYGFVQARHVRYGDCFKTNIFGNINVFFSSTGAAKIVLNNEGGNFTKKYIKSVGELVGDSSVLCASTQQHHKFIRSRLANLFSSSSLSVFTQQFDQLVMENLREWDHRQGTVVVLTEALKVTFKAMCKMLMSLEGEKELDMLGKDVAQVYDAMLAFPLKLPLTRFYKGIKARKRIMRTLKKIIHIRRAGLEAHEDFLQSLMSEDVVDRNTASSSSSSSYSSCSDGTPNNKLTEEEIQDNILTMIIAGQDTTASAITWMVKFLAENEEVLDKLKDEHFGLLEKTKDSLVTLEDLNRMPYASKVVKETLRMASIVAWYPRLVLQDCEIEGYSIKAGWSVNIDAKSIHLDSMIHKNPHKFNPSRFDHGPEQQGDELIKPYGFIPFSMGTRTCLGMHMAKTMMLVFLHRLITTYKWEVTDPDSSIEKWAMFARLRSGCPIHVTRTKMKDN